MEKTFNDVEDEFGQFKRLNPSTGLDITAFAKAMDEQDGAPLRQQAYSAPWYKRADALVDRGFEATRLPELTGGLGEFLGGATDKVLGTHVAPVIAGIGRDTPRMVAESLLTIPEVASGAGAPAAAGMWANRLNKLREIYSKAKPAAQALGYAGAGLKGYAQTDSPWGAAISAGTMYGANKLLLPAEMGGINVGGRAAKAATAALDTGEGEATSLAQRVLGPLVGAGTDVGAMTGLNEVSRQAQLSVGPHAVGLRDPARNPLTEENIAGDVANAAFFAPQLYHGLKNPQRLRTEVTHGMADTISARDDVENQAIASAAVPHPEDVASADPAERSRQEAVYGIIKSNLDAASIFDRDGNTADAGRARESALSAINEAAAGRYTPMPPELVSKIKETVDNEARLSTDARPEWLEKFTGEVKGILDTMNEGRVNYEEQAAQNRETMSPKDFAKWDAEQQKSKGESWHPGARDPAVVERLWSNEKLQPLTPEWLEKEYNATVDQGGNPKFATRVVAQKVANYMADRLPSAVEADLATRKAVTQTSPDTQKVSDLDRQFVTALSQLPSQIHEAVIRRTVEIQRNSNFSSGQAERMGVSEGVRIDPRSGRTMTPYPEWQKSVIDAARSYDPEARTILLKHRGKQYLKVPYTRLVEKAPSGHYLWEPQEVPLQKGAGGKSSSGGLVEGNIEAIPTKTGQDSAGATDEEAFKQALAEQQSGEGLLGTNRDAAQGLVMDESATLPEDKLALEAPTTDREADVGAKVAKGGEKLKATIAGLTDDQLWAVARDQFALGRGVQEADKKAGLRAALNAVLEGRFKETRLFFQRTSPTIGARMDKSTSEYHVDRAAKILQKLADPKVVERAKTQYKMQESEGGRVADATKLSDATADGFPEQWNVEKDQPGLPKGTYSPEQLRKLGYEVPKTQIGTEVDPGSPGTLVNQPPPGRFVQDVARTFKAHINDVLGREGYSGSTREFFTEMAVALARQMPTEGVDFYRLQGHPEGMVTGEVPQTQGRANLGVNLDKPVLPGEGRAHVMKLLQTLQHEITHLDGYIKDGLLAKPDAYSDERKRVFDNMMHLATNLNEDERAAMLSTIREYVPKEMQESLRQADGRPYGTSTPEEAVAQITGHVVNMLFFDTDRGRAAAKEMLDYAPQEFREFARNTFKTVGDIMQSMRSAAEGERQGVLTGKTDPFILTKGFDALIDSAHAMTQLRYVDHALSDARTFMAQANGAPQPGMTNSMWFTKSTTPYKAQESMPEGTSPTALEGFKAAADYIGPRAADKASRPNLIMRFLAPFRNEMWAMEKDGNRMARPVADAIFGLEGGSNRLVSNILSDFMKRNPDGSMKYDQDNALIRRIQQEPTGRWRDAGLNRVREWQQGIHEMTDGTKMDAQSMFVRDPKTGAVMVNPAIKGAQQAWDGMRTQLSKADQDLVMNASLALDSVGQRSKDVLLQQLKQSNTNKAAVLLMATNRDMPTQQALQLADAAHNAFLNGSVASLGGTIPPQQLAMLQSLFVGADGKSGLIGNLMKVGTHFDNRPGYSSEQLPHDWIVRYRNKDNEVKFDSRPTERQARALADSLRASGQRIDGEIVNRRDVNSLTRVDDPSDILTKLSEQENFVWDKFVTDMTTQHGTEVGQALRAGYTPLERSISQQAAQGVGKFLKERKGFVDRSSFDYLDAALASAQRLARSVAVKSMKEQVDLLLNDPSVRMRPSFGELVRGHVGEMLRPQSEVMKELKGIVSGYNIAANLGSVVTNAMQSLQTLLPVLDSKNPGGSFVKPWKQLGVAVKDATDMTLGSEWQKDVLSARGKDPSTWTEDETVASLWSRQVESGGFSHTVVDDLIYGTDQRLLANAKFGRGDYGPVERSQMVRSGMNLLNQFAMKPFRWVEHGNAKVAFLAGVRQAYEQGLRGDAAFSQANQVQGLATFGGGRANASGLHTALSKGFTPGGAGLALSLQQYGFGIVAMHAQLAKDAIGRSNMSPSEKFHARRVYGTALMTQVALAGTLGLPLVGAILTGLEKAFGIQANQAVRDGLAGLSTGPDGEPDETGQMIAEVGLNGFVDYLTGLDASSRLGTTSLLGTSSYRGFNWGDLAGPVGGMLENGFKSLNYFATGNTLQAASELVPRALRNAVLQTDMQHKYGDSGFRDSSGNLLYTPTPTEATAYKFGFRPRELSRRQQLKSALKTSNDLTTQANDRELDGAAESLSRGDGSSAMRLAMDRMAADPTQDYKDVLRQVMDRAVGGQVEQDLLATGSKLNESERSHIVRTFGADVNNRRSEVDLQKLRMQLATAIGDPSVAPNEQSFKQAAMIDALVQGQEMPRSQAVRLVQFLHLD